MSQLVYNNFPGETQEGSIVDSSPLRDIITRIAKQAATPFIPFGKLVVKPLTDADDIAKLPSLTTEITTVGLVLGVAIADTSLELPEGATFGHYVEDKAVPIMRKGRIKVIAEDEVTDLNKPVFVRFADPGVTPPNASLGSFRTDADVADAVAIVGARWRTTTVGTFQLAVLEVDF